MKTKTTLTILLLTFIHWCQAQTIEALYQQRDYQALIKYAEKAEELSGEDLYCIGYAFFQLENDVKAIEMYDQAIAKGLDEDYIYLYKGLSLRFNRQAEAAIKNFKLAIEKNPQGQKNHTELGNSYYFLEQYDTALVHFERARTLPYELGDPYWKLPSIYHLRQDFEKALEEYRRSADLINKEDPIYRELLKEIGLLEYTVFKNYNQAIATYQQVLALNPQDYDFYPKLIKAYYANEAFAQGDSLINVLKEAFEKGMLSEHFQKYGTVPIAEFTWNGQKLAVYKYFKTPTEMLDQMYKIYLLSKDGKNIERTFMTEKTLQLEEDGPQHLLCEREKDGAHHTYSVGWSSDDIEFKSLKNAVLTILNKKLKPAASSSLTSPEPEKSLKKKQKGKQK